VTHPGWYDDPWQPGWLRWWDGQQWGAQVAPRAPAFSGYEPQPLPLDAAVAAMKASDPEPWGVRPVVIPLLAYLVRTRGHVVTRTMIAEHVWDQHYDSFSNIVDVYVRYLRVKLDDGFQSKLIQTVRGVGYVFSPQSE